jgi:hypothetical protein
LFFLRINNAPTYSQVDPKDEKGSRRYEYEPLYGKSEREKNNY